MDSDFLKFHIIWFINWGPNNLAILEQTLQVHLVNVKQFESVKNRGEENREYHSSSLFAQFITDHAVQSLINPFQYLNAKVKLQGLILKPDQ